MHWGWGWLLHWSTRTPDDSPHYDDGAAMSRKNQFRRQLRLSVRLERSADLGVASFGTGNCDLHRFRSIAVIHHHAGARSPVWIQALENGIAHVVVTGNRRPDAISEPPIEE